MSILLAVSLAAAIQPTCSWDRPGHNPYKGTPAEAIDHYADIPEAVRGTLKRRMEEGLSDDKVSITRDGITGKNNYKPEIRDMHFGRNSMCNTVTRGKWAADRIEPAAVYCVGDHCILVPKICGNVSRITRTAPAIAAAAPPAPSGVLGYSEVNLEDAEPREEAMPLEPYLDGPRKPLRTIAYATPPGEPLGLPPKLIDQPYQPFQPFPGINPPFNNPGIPAPVPEPETWGMMLGGLGLVGWFARRRARAAAASAA